MKDIELLKQEMIRLSGGGRRLSKHRTSGLYCSINLPDFQGMKFLRNITKRFIDFQITSLEGKTVLDIGSNVGALSWEALNVGAKQVIGYEFNEERVQLCNDLAEYYGLNAKFNQADFNALELPKPDPAEVVIACSVDTYLDNPQKFYEWVCSITREDGVCYFESNMQGEEHTTMSIAKNLGKAGFKKIQYLGEGDSGGNARKRKTYRCYRIK